jgi:hypothetical protein
MLGLAKDMELCSYNDKYSMQANATGQALTTGENGEWVETKQRSENQVAFNSVLGPS